MSLKKILKKLTDIANESKKTEKARFIKRYSNDGIFRQVVIYAYDPFKRYKTTNVEYCSDVPEDIIPQQNVSRIFTYLDKLAKQSGCTNAESEYLSQISSIDEETVEVVRRIVNKDLRCGASKKTFKKFVKDMPYFEIMSCIDEVDRFVKNVCNNDKTKIMWSLKLDGVRTWNTVNNDGSVEHTSRKGLEYPNFGVFDPDCVRIAKYLNAHYNIQYPIVLDGEATASDKKFNSVMSNIRKLRNVDSSLFTFNVFDVVVPDIPLKKRYEMLSSAFKNLKLSKTKLVEHKYCEKDQDLNKLMNSAVNINKEEGIVIKYSESPYEFKEKSKYWCKMKPTKTFDLPVVGFYMGKSGKKHENRIGGLICKLNNVEVRVGSGYTDEEREEFLKTQPDIIEVIAKEITPDGSLREPRFVRVRDDKDTTD
jgi:ATP-dependent DNA ligase